MNLIWSVCCRVQNCFGKQSCAEVWPNAHVILARKIHHYQQLVNKVRAIMNEKAGGKFARFIEKPEKVLLWGFRLSLSLSQIEKT